jgi:hypothetical protein
VYQIGEVYARSCNVIALPRSCGLQSPVSGIAGRCCSRHASDATSARRSQSSLVMQTRWPPSRVFGTGSRRQITSVLSLRPFFASAVVAKAGVATATGTFAPD